MVAALVLLIIHMARGIAAGWESKNWPTVPGRIVASEGERFAGHNVYIFQMRYSQQRTAENVVRRYPKNKEIPVHYNPNQPDKAVLQPGVPGKSQGVLFLFIVLLAALLYSIVSGGFSLNT